MLVGTECASLRNYAVSLQERVHARIDTGLVPQNYKQPNSNRIIYGPEIEEGSLLVSKQNWLIHWYYVRVVHNHHYQTCMHTECNLNEVLSRVSNTLLLRQQSL